MWVIILLTVLLLAVLAGSLYFYGVAVARSPKTFLDSHPDMHSGSGAPVPKEASHHEWLAAQTCRHIEIDSEEGLRLHARLISGQHDCRGIAVLIHGYSGHGGQMARYARFYNEMLGWHVLMPDSRGHGGSEGEYIGFGWHDRHDYIRWAGRMVEMYGTDAEIVFHGVSMGAATVMMLSGEVLPAQVKAGIEDCGYVSVLEQLRWQLRRMYHLPAFPLLYTTSLITRLRAGYSFGEASAMAQVRKTALPLMFIHGDADTFVPCSMVYPLYEACRSPKALLVIPGAGHGHAMRNAPETYMTAVKDFLRPHLNQGLVP